VNTVDTIHAHIPTLRKVVDVAGATDKRSFPLLYVADNGELLDSGCVLSFN
jgi:hypothetical protein